MFLGWWKYYSRNLVKKVKEVDFCECKEVREGITAYLKHKLRSPSTQGVLNSKYANKNKNRHCPQK
jgi:hypothetical protein